MIKISEDNYFDKIKELSKEQFNQLPSDLKEVHDYIIEATGNGKTWQAFHQDEAIRDLMTDHFAHLSEYVNKHLDDKVSKSEKRVNKNTKLSIKPNTEREIVKQTKEKEASQVERIPDEIRFIKRFVNLHERVKTKEQILSFISALQKSIIEKRIRKASPYVKEIEFIQEKLIEMYHNMKGSIEVIINAKRLESLKAKALSQMVIPSIPYIKRYINLSGKFGIKAKAKDLMLQINKSLESNKITTNDPYYTQLTSIAANLFDFTKDTAEKALKIGKSELNGLEGILSTTPNGIEEDSSTNADEPIVMNSMDFANVSFVTIGLKGKWYDLIGDPAPGFTAMVYGKPKKGKSYLCVEFAGYLARHHGKVLYVAKEEGLDATLQIKTKDKDVAHPNLVMSDGLPKDLSPYDYIFLDSVTKLQLTPEDLGRLEKENPQKSFIYIFQTTKLGQFKGVNAFQHEVDIVIEVPEKGIAIQSGRFNQGGQISIFDNKQSLNKAA